MPVSAYSKTNRKYKKKSPKIFASFIIWYVLFCTQPARGQAQRIHFILCM